MNDRQQENERVTDKSMENYWETNKEQFDEQFENNTCTTCETKYEILSQPMKDYIRIAQILFYSLFRKTFAFGDHDPVCWSNKMTPNLFKTIFYDKEKKSRIFKILTSSSMKKSYAKLTDKSNTDEHIKTLDIELRTQVEKAKKHDLNPTKIKNKNGDIGDFESFIKKYEIESENADQINKKFLENFSPNPNPDELIPLIKKEKATIIKDRIHFSRFTCILVSGTC